MKRRKNERRKKGKNERKWERDEKNVFGQVLIMKEMKGNKIKMYTYK